MLFKETIPIYRNILIKQYDKKSTNPRRAPTVS